MKKTGIIITLLVVAILVAAITVKLSSQEDSNTNTQDSSYQSAGEAGKLTEGMVGLTAGNYDEKVTNSKGIVVVDYFAPSCSYCVKYTPIFSAVFEQYKDRAVFGKFDVTTDRTKLSDLELSGTPTTIIFKDGQEVSRIGGYVEEAELKSELDKVLSQ